MPADIKPALPAPHRFERYAGRQDRFLVVWRLEQNLAAGANDARCALVVGILVEIDGGGKTIRFTNVTIVCPPALTVTVAVPVARLLLTSNPALGNVLTPVRAMPAGIVSVITALPAGTVIGVLQEPPGAGPAGTVTGVPATLNVKFVPTATPEPAILQI